MQKKQNLIDLENEKNKANSGSPISRINKKSITPVKNREKILEVKDSLTPRPKPKKVSDKKTLTSLYDRAKEISESKEKKIKAIFDSSHPFQPKLNQQSLKMVKFAKLDGKDLHHSKKNEILSPQPSPEEFLQPKKTLSLKNFIDRNYTNQLAKYEDRKVPQFIPSLDRIDEDCTFKPVLDRKSLELAKSSQEHLYQRAMQKIEERKKKVEKAQQQKIEEALRLCTFAPKILEENNAKSKINSRSQSLSRGYSLKRQSFGTSPHRMSIEEIFSEVY